MSTPSYYEQPIIITDTSAASFVSYGGLQILNTVNSSGLGNGPLLIQGGASIAKDANLGGNVRIFSTAESTTSNTGALIVDGGVGIAKDLAVGGDVTISGSLYVVGENANIESTTVSIGDNTLVLNAGPSTSRDAGLLIHRYQVDNDVASGDVVADTSAASGAFQVGSAGTSAVLDAAASAVDNFYNHWWLRVTSGTGDDQVRQIVSYVGSTKTATLSSAFTTDPDAADTYSLYNKSYLTNYFDTATGSFVFGYTSHADDITTDLYSSGLANLAVKNLTGAVATFDTLNATNLEFTGAEAENFTVTDTATIENATITSLTVNDVLLTPSDGDIFTEGSFTAANNQSAAANITGLAFVNAETRSFVCELSATILTTGGTGDLYAHYTLTGVQKVGGWVLNSRLVGDPTGLVFSITSLGQVQYKSSNVVDFISSTLKFKANTTSL